MNDRLFSVRRAVPADAKSMVLLLQEIAAERMFTAITEPWSEAQQENHISGLSAGELIQVAEDQEGNVIGYQVLELWAPSLASMALVGQIGTFVGADWRSCGVGRRLFRSTHDFAAAHGYSKFVIQVRSGNTPAHPSTSSWVLNNAGDSNVRSGLTAWRRTRSLWNCFSEEQACGLACLS